MLRRLPLRDARPDIWPMHMIKRQTKLEHSALFSFREILS